MAPGSRADNRPASTTAKRSTSAPAKDEYSPQFALSLAFKDPHLALETVDASRFESFASLAHEWERAVDRGLGGQDLTVVTRVLEDGDGTG